MRKILLLLFLSVPLLAQGGIWGERGISRRFVLRGDVLYAADGRGVSVYDVSTAAAIRRIDVESGDAESYDLALVGDTDLVLATSAGLDRFSIHADGTLVRRGTTAVEGGVTHVAASNGTVVAAADQTLLILERTGDAWTVVNQRLFSASIRALAMNGSLAYVAVERTSIFAIDTNTGESAGSIPVDALDLAISGSTLWAAADIRGLFAIDVATREIVSVTGNGTYRFSEVAATGSRVYAIEAPDRVHVFDAVKLTEPRLAGMITDWANVIAASGTRLFLAGAIIDEENLPFETGVPVRVYDVANAAAPAIAGEYKDLAGPISGVWTDGSIAYVIDAPYLRILDVSKTAEPREISSIVVPKLQDWIRVKNGMAVNYGRVLVNLIDVSSPLRPKVIASWHTQGHAPSTAALARDTFVEANGHSGLHVVDYSNLAQPVQISGRIFHYFDMTAGDDAIYAIQQATFLTMDLTDRRQVVDRTVHSGQFFQLDTLPANSVSPHHVALRSAQALLLYSLEDRFAPRLIATIPMKEPGLFGTSDTSVYVTKDGALQRLDLADPTHFTPTDMAVTSPMQISVAGEKVVIADRYRLRVYGPDTAQPPAEPVRRRAIRH